MSEISRKLVRLGSIKESIKDNEQAIVMMDASDLLYILDCLELALRRADEAIVLGHDVKDKMSDLDKKFDSINKSVSIKYKTEDKSPKFKTEDAPKEKSQPTLFFKKGF